MDIDYKLRQSDDDCPKCGTYDLITFEPMDWVDAENGFRAIKCQHCGFTGKAWYKITFDGWEDSAGNVLDNFLEKADMPQE